MDINTFLHDDDLDSILELTFCVDGDPKNDVLSQIKTNMLVCKRWTGLMRVLAEIEFKRKRELLVHHIQPKRAFFSLPNILEGYLPSVEKEIETAILQKGGFSESFYVRQLLTAKNFDLYNGFVEALWSSVDDPAAIIFLPFAEYKRKGKTYVNVQIYRHKKVSNKSEIHKMYNIPIDGDPSESCILEERDTQRKKKMKERVSKRKNVPLEEIAIKWIWNIEKNHPP